MEQPRLHITPGMRRILDYPRFAGPTRMLVLETNYFFDQSWRRAAESLGWKTAAAPSAMVGGVSREALAELLTTLGAFKPDFILASNYAGMDTLGLFARFFEDARIPYVSWFTDTPRMILYEREVYPSHYSVVATWERAYTGHFRDLGFEHVFHMPLATDPELFNAPHADKWQRDLAFVGTSMIKEAAEAWNVLSHLPGVIRAVEAALDTGRVSPERLVQGVGAVIEPTALEGLSKGELRHVELCLIYEATRRQRTEAVKALEPLGVEVRGDPHWKLVTRRCHGGVGYFDDLAPYYRETAVNINVTSVQMRHAVNQRVFDCPAAGGFLLTDERADLLDLFEPDEVATFSDIGDLRDKAKWYLAHPEARARVVERARRRVLAEHTHAHRLKALEAYLWERYA